MTLSVTDTNPRQGGKNDKDNDKTKDVMVLMEDRLAVFTNSMSALTSRVEDMDKRIEDIESMGDMNELCGEMQVAMSSVVVDFKREIHALRLLEAAQGWRTLSSQGRGGGLQGRG